MKRPMTVVAVLLAALVLSGCAPESGTVTDKNVDHLHCDQALSPNPPYGCRSGYRTSYELYLDNGTDHGWREVPKDSWSKYEVGDTYPKAGGAR